MQAKTDRLNNFARQVGLSINTSKTQMMCVNSIPTAPTLVNQEPLEFVEDFTYLGSLISKDSGASKDIKARLGKAQGAFSQLRSIWRSKQHSLKMKMILYNCNVKSVLLYGSESWRVIKTGTGREWKCSIMVASDEYARYFGLIRSPTMNCTRKREAETLPRRLHTDA